jgi:putative restriction endonuclease
VRDKHPAGIPAVSNGLSLCKLHHGAFDGNLIGIRPDYVIEVRADVLREEDGPMLLHGLKEMHRRDLEVLPRRAHDKPDPAMLERRWEEFRGVA